MKLLKTKLTILILIGISIALLDGCNLPESSKRKKSTKYTVITGNWYGSSFYGCDYYERDGNTYQLFNKDSALVTEITLTAGYRIVINKN